MVRIALFFLVLLSTIAFGQKELKWKVYHPMKKNWLSVDKQGYIQQILEETGELPDPNYGRNAELYQWVEDHNWLFSTTFYLSENELKNRFIYFSTESIDCFAEIRINGELAYTTENAFIPYELDIKKWLKLDSNTIEIHFSSPINYHNKTGKYTDFTYPAPNDVGNKKVAPLTRKPQYHFGWDWTYRMNTIGFKSIPTLRFVKEFCVKEKKIQTVFINEKLAEMEISLKLDNDSIQELSWSSELFGEKIVKRKNGKFTRIEQLKNPKLWWPRGYGEPHLYLDAWRVKATGTEFTIGDIKFGIRKTELIQEDDQWGKSYYFKINGKRVFCKGGNMIPSDVFPNKVTRESIESTVNDAFEANFNMIRVWGGGFYPDDFFYEKCDELGIMVWQDFMFACAMYPADERFLKNVQNEMGYHIPRMSNHPCVVLLNGNNEVDVAWKNWGFRKTYQLSDKDAEQITNDYKLLFQQVIQSAVAKNSDIPYIHTSPLSNWAKKEEFNAGSQHYWGVWHGKDRLVDFGLKIGRFNAEFGFQSFPQISTIHAFADSTQFNLDSTVMKFHQKSYVGNKMISKHANLLFGTANSFEEFVYNSQLTQAIGVSYAVSGHRLDAPRCGGTIYWQLNDCWPAPTWSSVDYFGNWKASHYQMKNDFEPITVLKSIDSNAVETFFFISDLYDTTRQFVHYELFSESGMSLYQDSILIEGNGPFSEKLNVKIIPETVFLKFTFRDAHMSKSNKTYHLGKFSKRASKDDFNVRLLNPNTESKTIDLEVITDRPLGYFAVFSNSSECRVSENFFHILPGRKRIRLTYTNKIPILSDFSFQWK